GYLLRDLTRDLLLAGRLWRKMAREAAARHGVSEAASAPLIWIERLGENVRQNTLADAIGIEGASLVRLIDELQSSGLVTREPDPPDRRASAAAPTRRGREVAAKVLEDIQNLREQRCARPSAADIEATGRVFAALTEAAGKDTDQA